MYHDRKKKTALRHLKMHHFTPIFKKNSRGACPDPPSVLRRFAPSITALRACDLNSLLPPAPPKI